MSPDTSASGVEAGAAPSGTRPLQTGTPLGALVERLAPGVGGAAWMGGLCGVPAAELADLAELSIARSAEARRFLAHMEGTVRLLQSTTSMRSERCVGHVRGPILWSETVTAWSSGLGSEDVFVCIAPVRDYDRAENRVVAWLLHRLSRARIHLDTAASMRFEEAAREEIAHVADEARRWSRHRHLRDLPRRQPRTADLRKARATRHRAAYEAAFDLADRVAEPFAPDEADDLLDDLGRARLRAFLWIIEAVEDAGGRLPPLHVAGRALGTGRLVFRHPRHFPAEEAGIDVAGILVDAVVGDDPATLEQAGRDLIERAGGRPTGIVRSPQDASRVVREAIGRLSDR